MPERGRRLTARAPSGAMLVENLDWAHPFWPTFDPTPVDRTAPAVRNSAVLRALTVAALGVYTGAMLTEAFVLVPYWRALPPAEFLTWYAANDRRLFGFFGAVTILTVALAVATAIMSLRRRDGRRWCDAAAAILTVVALVMFPAYFADVNASFAAGTIGAGDVSAELARWATWHAARTVLACGALGAALVPRRPDASI